MRCHPRRAATFVEDPQGLDPQHLSVAARVAAARAARFRRCTRGDGGPVAWCSSRRAQVALRGLVWRRPALWSHAGIRGEALELEGGAPDAGRARPAID